MLQQCNCSVRAGLVRIAVIEASSHGDNWNMLCSALCHGIWNTYARSTNPPINGAPVVWWASRAYSSRLTGGMAEERPAQRSLFAVPAGADGWEMGSMTVPRICACSESRLPGRLETSEGGCPGDAPAYCVCEHPTHPPCPRP
jgi:hypothetical protein